MARKRGQMHGRKLALFTAVLAVIVAAVLVAWNAARYENRHGSQKLALIADGLSEDYPNQTLINKLKALLEEAGYKVVVKEGRQVNLKLYERLTRYNLIILRVHGGVAVEHTPYGNLYFGGIFTGIPWSDNYTKLGEERYVAKARPLLAPHKLYVAVLPRFWEEKLQGRFPPGSVMIVSSCWATVDPKVIAAFFDHGLDMYIGWNKKVTLKHADEALLMLVDDVVKRHLTWEQAVVDVNTRLGPDPKTGSQLYYALRIHYVSQAKK